MTTIALDKKVTGVSSLLLPVIRDSYALLNHERHQVPTNAFSERNTERESVFFSICPDKEAPAAFWCLVHQLISCLGLRAKTNDDSGLVRWLFFRMMHSTTGGCNRPRLSRPTVIRNVLLLLLLVVACEDPITG